MHEFLNADGWVQQPTPDGAGHDEGRQGAGGPGGTSAPNNQNTIQKCAQAGQAAASSVPSSKPSGQDVYESTFGAVMGAAVGVAGTVAAAPEDGVVTSPFVYKAISGIVTTTITGLFNNALARFIQRSVVSAVTTQGCLIMSGNTAAATPALY